jgi:hypothetical protein
MAKKKTGGLSDQNKAAIRINFTTWLRNPDLKQQYYDNNIGAKKRLEADALWQELVDKHHAQQASSTVAAAATITPTPSSSTSTPNTAVTNDPGQVASTAATEGTANLASVFSDVNLAAELTHDSGCWNPRLRRRSRGRYDMRRRKTCQQ